MRRKVNIKRNLQPDTKFGSVLVAKFINQVMRQGKKSVAQKIVHGALKGIEEKSKKPGLEILETAIKNVSPQLEVKSRRIGGATYQVPREVRGERKTTLAMRWILQAVRKRKGAATTQKLAEEILLAAKGEGAAIKKRNDTHRMAEANRAFAHFSW